MNKLETIAKILGITLSSSQVVEETLAAEGKLADGTRIFTEADAFVVGSAVQIESEAGMIPAPAGQHVLEDGNIIVVDEAGVIVEIKVPEAEEVEEEELAEEEVEEEEIEEEKFAFGKKDYDEMMERIQKLEEVLLGAVEALNNTNKELNEKVEALSAQPAAQPIKTRKPVVEENALAALKLPKRK
jgi:hypothetical protein